MAVTGIASSLAILGHKVKVVICGQSVLDTHKNSFFFDKLVQSGAKINILHRKYESKYGAILRFREMKSVWIDVRKSDFVILHQVFEMQYLAIIPMLFLLKKPYFVMPHGTLTTYQRRQHKFRKLPFIPITYLFLKFSRGIFLATELEKSQLPRFLYSNAYTVGIGIDLPEIDLLNRKNNVETFNLLFLGRIAKKKRLDITLQAFAIVKNKTDLKVKLIICGSGEKDEVEVLKGLVKHLGINSEVEFRGWVDKENKLNSLLESDCFILTSEDENFAIAAAEALSFGIPCVLSSNVALASLVTDYSAGATFSNLVPNEVADAILRVLNLNKVELSTNSLNAASKISWDCVAFKWEAQIRELLGV